VEISSEKETPLPLHGGRRPPAEGAESKKRCRKKGEGEGETVAGSLEGGGGEGGGWLRARLSQTWRRSSGNHVVPGSRARKTHLWKNSGGMGL